MLTKTSASFWLCALLMLAGISHYPLIIGCKLQYLLQSSNLLIIFPASLSLSLSFLSSSFSWKRIQTLTPCSVRMIQLWGMNKNKKISCNNLCVNNCNILFLHAHFVARIQWLPTFWRFCTWKQPFFFYFRCVFFLGSK